MFGDGGRVGSDLISIIFFYYFIYFCFIFFLHFCFVFDTIVKKLGIPAINVWGDFYGEFQDLGNPNNILSINSTINNVYSTIR